MNSQIKNLICLNNLWSISLHDFDILLASFTYNLSNLVSILHIILSCLPLSKLSFLIFFFYFLYLSYLSRFRASSFFYFLSFPFNKSFRFMSNHHQCLFISSPCIMNDKYTYQQKLFLKSLWEWFNMHVIAALSLFYNFHQYIA